MRKCFPRIALAVIGGVMSFPAFSGEKEDRYENCIKEQSPLHAIGCAAVGVTAGSLAFFTGGVSALLVPAALAWCKKASDENAEHKEFCARESGVYKTP